MSRTSLVPTPAAGRRWRWEDKMAQGKKKKKMAQGLQALMTRPGHFSRGQTGTYPTLALVFLNDLSKVLLLGQQLRALRLQLKSDPHRNVRSQLRPHAVPASHSTQHFQRPPPHLPFPSLRS